MGPVKRAKTTNNGPATPVQLYRQAARLVRQQPCGDISSDELIAQWLQQCIEALKTETLPAESVVKHSLDLDIEDEPAFLLASAYLQLGQLYRRQDKLDLAQQHFESSLKLFPEFAAAHSELGQVLKQSAASIAGLQQAEHHLTTAVNIAAQLSDQENGLLVDSNKACAAEVDAADAARAALAMLLCQAGRDEEAAVHLSNLGYKFRLSRQVLHYNIPQIAMKSEPACERAQDKTSHSSNNRSSLFLQVLDNALPVALLEHLQQAFGSPSPFWTQHNYGRVGYFSYMFRLDDKQSSSMHQLAHHLQQLAVKYLPAAANAQYVEFWAHCRRHSAGHQLHYDSDDEGQGGIRNPIFTSVLYLNPNTSDRPDSTAEVKNSSSSTNKSNSSKQQFIGGPTLVTDQVLGGPLANQGWLSYPVVNRFTMFDGRYLHGVIPGRGVSPSTDGRRCTLMMAFWKDLKVRTPPGSGIGACMPMPDVNADDAQQWTQLLKAKAGGWGTSEPVPVQTPPPVDHVWQPVTAAASKAAASYDACFQGF